MPQDLENLNIFTNMQQSEARLHWSRNNYFLTCSSILMVAFSLMKTQVFQILVACLGLILNIAWLLIQYRSSKYILYWKTEAEKLSSSGEAPSIYPKKVGGLEMRRVAFILPSAFLLFWGIVILALLIQK